MIFRDLNRNIRLEQMHEPFSHRGLSACFLQFTSDLHAVHSGRRQLAVARCHAKLWPLSVQSHH